jgi:hypothetical protein
VGSIGVLLGAYFLPLAELRLVGAEQLVDELFNHW